jgi:uncharacterized phage infection (PIP) family protein YhgE
VQEIGREAQEKVDPLENRIADPNDKSELKQALEQLRNSRSSEETQKALADMVRIGRKALERPDMQRAKAQQENLQSRAFQPARTEQGGRVQEALAKGDYKEARAAARELQRELDRLIKEGQEKNKDKIDQFKDDLKKLADDLRAPGRDRNLERSLEKAGVAPDDARRMLDQLNKPETPQQQRENLEKEIRERLAKAGLDQQKIDQAIQQAREKANENRDLSRLADKLDQAARRLQQGDAGNIDPQEIENALNQAGDELGELEKLADSLRDVQSGLSELNKLREDLAKQDRQAGRQPGRQPGGDECEGEGECAHADAEGKGKAGKSGRCPICGKRRSGAGEPGEGGPSDENQQAWGARPDKKETDFKLTPDKLKGTILKDKIIGRQLVDGANIAGKDEISYTGQIQQGRRAAAAMMRNDVIPGAYHDTVKRYYELNREGKADAKKE